MPRNRHKTPVDWGEFEALLLLTDWQKHTGPQFPPVANMWLKLDKQHRQVRWARIQMYKYHWDFTMCIPTENVDYVIGVIGRCKRMHNNSTTKLSEMLWDAQQPQFSRLRKVLSMTEQVLK